MHKNLSHSCTHVVFDRKKDITQLKVSTQIISETLFEWILPDDYGRAEPEHSINVTDYESEVVSSGYTALKDKVQSVMDKESMDFVYVQNKR